MSYYDNVKDNIRSNKKEKKEKEGDTVTGNFDSLREAAEETSEEEGEGDDTPIEVLEEDGLSTESPKKREQKQKRQKKQRKEIQPRNNTQETNPLKNKGSNESVDNKSKRLEADLSSLEEKMDKMIEQNDELIKILRSFTE